MNLGDEVYLKAYGSNIKRHGTELIKATVIKKGRLYIEVKLEDSIQTAKFKLPTMQHHNNGLSPAWEFFSSKQDWLDHEEKLELITDFKQKFERESHTLTIDQLRKIKEILQ
ncbi:beta barrel domain-containing protein [Paenibacillus sp. Leaf72]|uniref:beta barrel domain-containing protein n=1 Tax=Paenibacillus sp. Leaf72 TaxID=1736234 RepID=UPI0006F7D45D|nr:hypothetical protein [Paenibacillus sp. Leaf72]KQN96977.1 hypothetical protein ASF12_23195 [Paenibacillus sp. Leaf72]